MVIKKKAKTKTQPKIRKAVKKKTAAKKKIVKKKTIKKKTLKKSLKEVAGKKTRKKTTRKKTVAVPAIEKKPPVVEPGPPAVVVPPVEEPSQHEEAAGVVTHYYSHLSVAVIQVNNGVLKIGDRIHIKGHTTDFTQNIESMEYEHQHIEQAAAGQSVGVKVFDPVREHDVVYLIK